MPRRPYIRAGIKHYQWKLDERSSVVFDANGGGTVTFAPGGAREKWVINFITTVVTNVVPASNLVPQLILYRSAAIPGNQLGGTFSAFQDTSTVVYELNMNEPIVCVFSGGDPDSIGTVHIEGVRHVWGN
jgi:hypothetical protein